MIGRTLGALAIGSGLLAGMVVGAVDAQESTPTAGNQACAAPTRAEAEALLGAWWSEGWAGDAEALDATTSDQVLHHWAIGPDTVGTEAQRERIDALRTAMPDLAITFGEILVDGDRAAATWQVTGTQTGNLMGQPPTGARADVDGINVFRIECGEIVEVWSEMDALGFLDQLAGTGDTSAATPAP